MKRTTVSLPEEDLGRALVLAGRGRKSLGAIVREALRAYLDRDIEWEAPRSLGFGDSLRAARGRELGELPPEAYGAGPR